MAKKLKKSPEYSVFFNTLIDLCDHQGISVTNIVEQFSSSKSAMTAWKNGKISVDLIPKLAQELNCSVSALFNCKEKSSSTELSEDERELLKYFKQLSNHEQTKLIGRAELLAEQETSKTLEITATKPTITLKHSVYKVSAGTGYDLGYGDEWNELQIPDTHEAHKADFCLTISGNSMEPVYYDGDIVLVKEQLAVELGQIGIFFIEGAGYIKKFGGDRLISLNAEYDDIMFKDYDPEDIRCNGLVIGRV